MYVMYVYKHSEICLYLSLSLPLICTFPLPPIMPHICADKLTLIHTYMSASRHVLAFRLAHGSEISQPIEQLTSQQADQEPKCIFGQLYCASTAAAQLLPQLLCVYRYMFSSAYCLFCMRCFCTYAATNLLARHMCTYTRTHFPVNMYLLCRQLLWEIKICTLSIHCFLAIFTLFILHYLLLYKLPCLLLLLPSSHSLCGLHSPTSHQLFYCLSCGLSD